MVANLPKFSVYTQENMKRDVGGFKFQRFSTNGHEVGPGDPWVQLPPSGLYWAPDSACGLLRSWAR